MATAGHRPPPNPADNEDTLWSVASSFAGCVTRKALAEAVGSEGGGAVGASVANVLVVEPTKRPERRLVLTIAGSDSTASDSLVDLAESRPAWDAIRTGLPVLLGSVEEMTRRYPGLERWPETAGIRAAAALPLRSGSGSSLGAVVFGWDAAQSFDAGLLRRLDVIAILAGLALERATGEKPPGDPAALRALETMPNVVLSLDGSIRFTYANAEAERAFGRRFSEIVGRGPAQVFPDAFGSNFELRCREAIETGQAIVFDGYCPPLEGWFEIHLWPDLAGLHALFLNISDRRRTDLQRISALGEAERSNARLRLLGEISSRLSGISTRDEVFERLIEQIVPSFADWCTLVVPRGEELVRVAAVHRDPALNGLAKRLVGSYPHAFSGPSPGVVVYRNGTPMRLARLAQQIIADLDDSAASHAYGRTLKLLGDGPGLIMPITSRDEIVAVLTMIRSEDEHPGAEPFSDADVAFMHDVAASVARALDYARNVETQRETASALQSAALPRELPVTDQLSLAAGYRVASEGIEVGGDWYDAFDLPNGRVALVVGDAAGHGVRAAAAMAQMRNELRAYLFASLGPMESLASLNRLLIAQSPDTFATIICLEIDPFSGAVRWASAGHPAPVLVSASGTSTYLQGQPMPPIGLVEGPTPDLSLERKFVLTAHDRLILFTDGLVERRGVDWEIGLTHLMILAEQTRDDTDATVACERILREMLDSPHEDDVCLLVADFTATQ